MKLEGKVGIVTGAGRGIGRGIALALAQEGAAVVVADIDSASAENVAKEIEQMGQKAMAAQVDITKSTEVNAMVGKALAAYGKIDILVNNVGWNKVQPFVNGTEEFWEKVIAINLKGPVICCRAVIDNMIQNNYGKIINISSDAGRVGSTGESIYSAAKGGVIAFTKTLAREMARYKINVNCISPGPSDTPFFASVAEENPKLMEAVKKGIPWRRLGQPEDIANAVVFLASEGAEYITGQTLSVSGGLTMV